MDQARALARRKKALAHKLSTRDREIVRMFSMGYWPAKILAELEAQGVKMSVGSLYRIREKALQKVQAETDELADKIRYQELDRLELAREAIAEEVKKGELFYIDRWIRLSESIRKLRGLDPASKTESKVQVTGQDGDYSLALEGLVQRVRKWEPTKTTDQILAELMDKVKEGEPASVPVPE